MGSDLRNCGDCGVAPGLHHVPGCDVERCAICGFQAISCGCIYELSGMDRDRLEETHPDVHENGPTQDMLDKLDDEVSALGGPVPWSGEYPGKDACREFGLFCVWKDRWVACGRDEPGATEDLNRLYAHARWDKVARRYVLRA